MFRYTICHFSSNQNSWYIYIRKRIPSNLPGYNRFDLFVVFRMSIIMKNYSHLLVSMSDRTIFDDDYDYFLFFSHIQEKNRKWEDCYCAVWFQSLIEIHPESVSFLFPINIKIRGNKPQCSYTSIVSSFSHDRLSFPRIKFVRRKKKKENLSMQQFARFIDRKSSAGNYDSMNHDTRLLC